MHHQPRIVIVLVIRFDVRLYLGQRQIVNAVCEDDLIGISTRDQSVLGSDRTRAGGNGLCCLLRCFRLFRGLDRRFFGGLDRLTRLVSCHRLVVIFIVIRIFRRHHLADLENT